MREESWRRRGKEEYFTIDEVRNERYSRETIGESSRILIVFSLESTDLNGRGSRQSASRTRNAKRKFRGIRRRKKENEAHLISVELHNERDQISEHICLHSKSYRRSAG